MSNNVSAKTKGWIKNNVTGVTKSFQFNPTDLSYSRGATYADISAPGMAYPSTQFVQGNVRSFPISLFFFDNPCTGVIEDYISFFEGLLPPEENASSFSQPPDLTFCYGYFIRKCVVEDLSINIERMDENGSPIQAIIDLQLRQVGI